MKYPPQTRDFGIAVALSCILLGIPVTSYATENDAAQLPNPTANESVIIEEASLEGSDTNTASIATTPATTAKQETARTNVPVSSSEESAEQTDSLAKNGKTGSAEKIDDESGQERHGATPPSSFSTENTNAKTDNVTPTPEKSQTTASEDSATTSPADSASTADADAPRQKLSNQWIVFGGKHYYLSNDGCPLTSQWHDVNGAWFYLSEDGAALTGLQSINGQMYYFDRNGQLLTGWIPQGDSWYHTDGNGHLESGWQNIDGAQYWFSPETNESATGWQEINNERYYFAPTGVKQANVWVTSDYGSDVFLAPSGAASLEFTQGRVQRCKTNENLSGWVDVENEWFFAEPNTTASHGVHHGWLNNGGSWYYLDAITGIMHANGWEYQGGRWYWLNPSGAMSTGWQTLNGREYYFDATGVLHDAQQDAETELQRRLVWAAQHTPSPGGNLCAYWVSLVFRNAGLGYPGGNACDMARAWTWSSDFNDLRVGMIIAVPSHTHSYMGGIYGHVGIYVGNNTIMDNVGRIRTVSLRYWSEYYHTTHTPMWGWVFNRALC